MAGLYNLKKGRAVFLMRSKEYDVDNGAGTTDDDVLIAPSVPCKIVDIRAVYTVATDSAGSGSANFKVGSAAGGAQHCAATSLVVSKSAGTYTSATIVSGDVAANGAIHIRHTGVAATEAGKYRVQIMLEVVDAHGNG